MVSGLSTSTDQKGWCRHQPYLKDQCVRQAGLVIDASNHRELVGARHEVLHDYDRRSSTHSFKTTSAALEDHVSGRDSSS